MEANHIWTRRYHELGSHALGQRRGWWIITIPQLVVMVGLGITCVSPCHTDLRSGLATPWPSRLN